MSSATESAVRDELRCEWMSIDQLVYATQLSRPTVRRALSSLSRDLMLIERRGEKPARGPSPREFTLSLHARRQP